MSSVSLRGVACACVLLVVLHRASGAQGQGRQQPTTGQSLVSIDFTGTAAGTFPGTLQKLDGVMEVVDWLGQRMLKASARSTFLVPLPAVLPKDFTLAFDLVPKMCCNPEDIGFEGTPAINQGAQSSNVLWHREWVAVVGGGNTYDSRMPEAIALTLPGALTEVVIEMQDEQMKFYANGLLTHTVNSHKFVRGRTLRVFLGGQNTTDQAVYLAGLRITAGVSPVMASNPPAPAPLNAVLAVSPTPSGTAAALSTAPPVLTAAPVASPIGTAAPPTTQAVMAAPPGGTATPMDPTRYRLVALGFRVEQQSKDINDARDGIGDEIYFSAIVNQTTLTGVPLPITGAANAVMLKTQSVGDQAVSVPYGRLKGGTASSSGGFRSGDAEPPNLDPRGPTGVPQTDRFPMLLWEGTLDDKTAIVVHPTLWEDDVDPVVQALWAKMVLDHAAQGYALSGNTTGMISTLSGPTAFSDIYQLPNPQGNLGGTHLFDCTTILINLVRRPCEAHGVDRPIGLWGGHHPGEWWEAVIVLTKVGIQNALYGPVKAYEPYLSMSTGTFAIPLLDDAGAPGTTEAIARYHLYFRLERVP